MNTQKTQVTFLFLSTMKIGGGNGGGVSYCHFIIISDVNAIKCFSDFFLLQETWNSLWIKIDCLDLLLFNSGGGWWCNAIFIVVGLLTAD